MLWNGYHAKKGNILGRWLGRQCQVGLDHILQLIFWLLHGLVNDDPVHGATKV